MERALRILTGGWQGESITNFTGGYFPFDSDIASLVDWHVSIVQNPNLYTAARQVCDTVQCRGYATNSFTGEAINPAAVSFSFRHPATGVVTTYVYGTDPELYRLVTGEYFVNLYADAIGVWRYGFRSTVNGVAASADGVFRVGPSRRS